MTVPRISAPRISASLVALTAGLVAAGLALAACTPGVPSSDPASPTPTVVVPSDTPLPVETDGGTGASDAELRANVVDAMSSGNTAAIEGYLASSVHITYAASEYEGDVTDPALIIQNLTALTGPGITWDFNLPAATLDNYANNPGHYPAYSDDFPEGALVGRSSDRAVVSFAIDGGQITRVFIALDEGALTFE
ncbi:MAG: hypothetical protein R2717_08865 [Schumannella sp.]